ncbi:very short patch repair endonuclease [Phycicoccus sp. M110.8]|uniref:very short patch repair endonuclease n=1 Tax=Phycicoccus sp. M110.8 TaxID=3075433 RepID=UPI0028FD986E|nr:very short patch repair endonuclease [Phycicoccus sp. M110.8]MDU0314401.1 very short patch repair endonuclease [Phycicoccus sp. M110.8]
MRTPSSWASTPGRRRIMQANRSRDTKPELAVRKVLHAAGFRYRVSYPPVAQLRRRADIVFTRQRVAVFIDGCFWHGCPQHGRRQFSVNGDYWVPKIAANHARDRDTDQRLRTAGWLVLRFWEHQDPFAVAEEIADAVAARLRSI